MSYTDHFALKKLGSGDHLSDESNKFTTVDRDTIDLLLYLGAQGHHHNGGPGSETADPEDALLVSLVTNSGVLPAGQRIYYQYTYVNASGLETGPAPEVFVDTPAQVASPGKPTLSSASTGGTLAPGNYYYVLSAYSGASVFETPATNPDFLLVEGVTVTNTLTLTLPTLPSGADGFNVYRQAPAGPGYFFIASVDMTAATPPSSWTDTGSTPPNCDRTRPTVNTTQQTNSIIVSLPGSPVLDPGQSWRVYRTMTTGDWTNSLLATVTDAVTYTDTGTPTTLGQPPFGGTAVGSPAPIGLTDGAEVEGALPLGTVSGFPLIVTFEQPGLLNDTTTGTIPWICEFPYATVIACRATLGVGSTPALQDVIVDINKGFGATPTFTTIYTDQAARPRVAVGTTVGARTQPAVRSLMEGDALTVDIDQVGAGAVPTDVDLIVNIYLIVSGYPDDTSFVYGTVTGSGA